MGRMDYNVLVRMHVLDPDEITSALLAGYNARLPGESSERHACMDGRVDRDVHSIAYMELVEHLIDSRLPFLPLRLLVFGAGLASDAPVFMMYHDITFVYDGIYLYMLLLISGYDKMDEETFVEFGIGMVIIFSIFNYLYPAAHFFLFLITAIAVIGVFLFLKGLLQYVASGHKDNIWAGMVFIMIIVILFGGLNIVLDAFRFVLSFALTVVDNGLSYLASLV